VNQIVDRLGLGEIDSPIEKGSRVNSPGWASSAPFELSIRTTSASTTGEPWMTARRYLRQ
jgi:hypothetical protein